MLEINIPEIVAEVTAAFERYEHALVTNDVATLDAIFWNSPRALRFGINENLYGYDAIANFRSNRPAINLARTLMNTVITTYGRDMATANTEFQRPGAPLSGRQKSCLDADRPRLAHRRRACEPAPAAGPTGAGQPGLGGASRRYVRGDGARRRHHSRSRSAAIRWRARRKCTRRCGWPTI